VGAVVGVVVGTVGVSAAAGACPEEEEVEVLRLWTAVVKFTSLQGTRLTFGN